MSRLPARDIRPKSVKRFRGISQYVNSVMLPLDVATDLNNCIVSGAGHLEKLRVPKAVTAAINLINPVPTLMETFTDFSQGDGTRQVIAQAGGALFYFTDDAPPAPYTAHLIEQGNPLDAALFNYASANNILFMANGQRMCKWVVADSGNHLWQWGIDVPPAAPTWGIKFSITGITRAAGVTTVTITNPNNIAINIQGGDASDLLDIEGVTDASFNGMFYAHSGAGQPIYLNPGANATLGAGGTCTIYSSVSGFGAVSVSRSKGVSTIVVSVAAANQATIGNDLFVTGMTGGDAVFNGQWVVSAKDPITGSISFVQVGPDIASHAVGAGNVSCAAFIGTSKRSWRYGYKNSITGHEGPTSDVSAPPPAIPDNVNQRLYFISATAPTDPQVDTIVWYATAQNGGDWFVYNKFELPIATGLTVVDGLNDDFLDYSQRANFINYPPPVAKFLVQWQGRIYAIGIAGAPQDFVWSGYEKILRGRPEEAFPPDNRGRLSIGADELRGLGMLMNGIVIWDSNNRMRFFKGTVEDIVTGIPLNFTEYLEELPWATGVSSHVSIQSTPYGVVWFGSDHTVHKWNGIFYGEVVGPTDIGINISPLLKRITPGTEQNIPSAYFNFLERDWYVILLAVDGSASFNRIVFFDMSKEAEDNLGVWISDVQADYIGVREDNVGIRHLLISQGGKLWEIKANSTTVGGVHKTIDSTTSELEAFWTSGLDDGGDSQTVKMYRYGRLVTDQSGFNLLVTIVNDTTSVVKAPSYVKSVKVNSKNGRFAVNRRGRRQSFTIVFPKQDTDASVLELATNLIPLYNG